MLCSSSLSSGRVAVVPSSTLSPSSASNSLLEKRQHKYSSEKDLPTQRISGNFLTKRLLPSTSKRMTDDDLFMVQKSIEARSQRSRRSAGTTNKSDVNQFLKESSRRYRPATRLTSVASLESTASDLLAADRAQANELPNVEQLTLTETQQQHVEIQHDLCSTDSVTAQPRRKRGSLLRRLSSTFQRDASMTRYDNFDGHRDSLEIIRRQIQADGIVYRPRIPHPILDGLDCDEEDKGCKEESSSNNVDNIAMNSSPAACRSNNVKQREEVEEHQDVVNTCSDRASQENPSFVLPVHETAQHNRGHHKISAENNATPLPPQLHNEKVGYARSA